MSRPQTQKQSSREFRNYTVVKRGKDVNVRVPQFSPKLIGDTLIRQVAKAAYATTEDRDKAVQLMEDWITADYKLNQRIVKPIIDLMCRNGIDAIIRATRPADRKSVTNPTAARMDGIQRASARNIMDFKIRHGLKWTNLGDCTKEILLEVADSRDKAAATMNGDAAWFRRIAKELSPKQKVKDALAVADVERYRDQTHKAVA